MTDAGNTGARRESIAAVADRPINCCGEGSGVLFGHMGAGEVPPSMVIEKSLVDDDITLDWSASCVGESYAVYEGLMDGFFDSHVAETCGTFPGGTTELTFTPNAQSSYYLVAPYLGTDCFPDGGFEGSYGQSSFGERSPSEFPCKLQSIVNCDP